MKDISKLQHLRFCTACPHAGGICKPAYELLQKVAGAVAKVGPLVSEGFAFTGTSDVSCSQRTCAAQFSASLAGSYICIDHLQAGDLETLFARARQYHEAACRSAAADDLSEYLRSQSSIGSVIVMAVAAGALQ